MKLRRRLGELLAETIVRRAMSLGPAIGGRCLWSMPHAARFVFFFFTIRVHSTPVGRSRIVWAVAVCAEFKKNACGDEIYVSASVWLISMLISRLSPWRSLLSFL